MQYCKINEEIITHLKEIFGEKNVLTDSVKMEPYSHDEVPDDIYKSMPEAVCFAESTEQVAAIMKLANQYHFPVVPRGGGSGLACGATPIYGGVVLSLEKMNKIIEINTDAMYVVTEPGVRTTDLQEAVEEHDLFYAGDPCSGDSCHIGGNIATNAGGNRAVKYGTTRHQVYSIEVVTPTGEITTLGARLKKQTTGYCLDQLIIGSEGTLGIITKATLKLVPKPQNVLDVLAIFEKVDDAIGIVNKIIKAGISPTCIEYMDNVTIKSVERYLGETLQGSDYGNYVIIQVEAVSEDQLDEKIMQLDELCTENGAREVLAADSEVIWKARKSFAEAVRIETIVVNKEDIVAPVEQLPKVFAFIAELAHKYNLITRIASHAGDGNTHLNILKDKETSVEDFHANVRLMQDELFTYLYSIEGRLSGEHGIGYKRKELMEAFTDPVELNIMKTIKKAMDPNNVLNPGKIFDIN